MRALAAALREVVGLFVDDGLLALQLVAVVAAAALCMGLAPDRPLLAGGLLFLGTLAALLTNVLRASRRR